MHEIINISRELSRDLKQREEMIEKSMRIIEDLQRIGKVTSILTFFVFYTDNSRLK